jgi:hypothetical protein
MKSTIKCLFLLVLLVLSVTASAAGRVNMMRILREHKVTVVSTEPAAKLAKHFLDWRVSVDRVLTPAELLAQKDTLPGDGDVLFIIDRTKEQNISTLERQLFPLPVGAIEPDAVLTFVSKTAYKRNRKYKNGWDILVSVPDEAWLQKTLKMVPQVLGQDVDERAPVKLYDFAVKSLLIVSNATKDIAANWAEAQFDPTKIAIDWEFVSADHWKGVNPEERDVLFLLSTANMADPSPTFLEGLPQDILTWLASDVSRTEAAACHGNAGPESSVPWASYALVAPSERHLLQNLKQYSTIGAIPDALASRKYADLRGYEVLGVAVNTVDPSLFHDSDLKGFAARLTSELTARVPGFTCSAQQDLLETEYAKDLAAQSDIDSAEAEEIHAKIKAQALIVLDISSVTKRTSFHANEPVRVTALLPPYPEPEPSRPVPPDPDAWGMHKGKNYRVVDGDRRNDPEYRSDYSRYEDDLKRYPGRHRRWEWDRDKYEKQRDDRMIDWEVALDAVQRAQVAGNLRLFDMRQASPTIGQLEYSHAVSGAASLHSSYETRRASVRGETNRPPSPDIPAARPGIEDMSLVSEAFQDACVLAAEDIVENSILPADMR